MQKGQKQKLFTQYYLSSLDNLDITPTSKYKKVASFTKGCLVRRQKYLYQNLKCFTNDLQTILDYDPESASVVFEQYNQIRISYNQQNKQQSKVKAQCRRCGQFAIPFKFCPKCGDVHYCSQACQVNVKLTHEKQECKIRSYPKVQHPVIIQVHFGSNLGQNIQVYFQHQARAYGLARGKAIIKQMYQYFSGIKKQSKPEFKQVTQRSNLEQKLMKYKIQMKNSDKWIQFQLRNQSDFPTGVLKVELQDMDSLKRLYEQNQLLEQIELYLLTKGALIIQCSEQVHNNHAHWVYIFKMP